MTCEKLVRSLNFYSGCTALSCKTALQGGGSRGRIPAGLEGVTFDVAQEAQHSGKISH